MPNLRRSLQSKSSTGSQSPTRSHATPIGAGLAPPRKVIKALYDYNSQQPEEMPFSKGDFFHVIGNEDDEDWYEACNPITGARGYVPVTYFQILEKNGSQQQQRSQYRKSNQSIEDTGNDSGTFTEPLPQKYFAPKLSPQPFYQQPVSGGVTGLQSAPLPVTSQKTGPTPSLPKCQPLYGIVLYDFGAERADELDCKVGDAILVIAQSNEDWYVAKPIGRLGGPGLIPVKFVEIRDMVTGKPIDVPEMLRQTGTVIPRVDEWKKQTMEYKAKSIPLGRIDVTDVPQAAVTTGAQPISPQQPASAPLPLPVHLNGEQTIHQLKSKVPRADYKASHIRDQHGRRNPSQDLDIGRRVESINGVRGVPTIARSHNHDAYEDRHHHHPAYPHHQHTHSGGSIQYYHHNPHRIIHASVESFHLADGQYWFNVRVEIASGAVRSLFRLYEDFYNFHIALLEEFPVESGRVGDQPRILPFMPIPLPNVTETVSATRRKDLDLYVQDLCKLPPRIMQHPLVENLFAVRDGDTETPPNEQKQPDRTSGTRSTSPALGRSHPARDLDRRPSPSAGSRGTRPPFVSRPQQSTRSYGDESPGGSSPGVRSLSQFPAAPSTPVATAVGTTAAATVPPPSQGLPLAIKTAEDMIKVKISYQEDIMAMRIPVSIGFKALQQKIFDRLQIEPHRTLSYRDDHGDFAIIQTDADVRAAMDRSGGKLMVYVD
ncbi:bud emergence protein 1 [Lobosporangium transversale]|uniref:SH3 domain-containing protein n=1 Tax=Lobosporangium transversale TaxID=64571 RepID=A0A1Y2GSQ0_9FUNG|nr:hypothetical protein BCR41DRAFT_385592 [Lobosporangium transversale]KAF9916463.1 bud emergence protein 1 [Lobosporangium transversale]ORZ20008.1 hypothetical protein BCR41DRAFT_385592 [Lobosporangium transversale]|eukprot:XP_021882548.1 hypothetical protein BCR41DRAFT_385592 [Lobosporangium transversale]